MASSSSSCRPSDDPKPVAKWVNARTGSLPLNGQLQAVVGGYDITNETLYVGRAEHQGNLFPGKINRSHGVCYVPFNGKEIAYESYQVLTQPTDSDRKLVWLEGSHGKVPPNAIQGGVGSDGERYYIGRVLHENTLVVGTIIPSKRALAFAFAGGEHIYQNYEVLCVE